MIPAWIQNLFVAQKRTPLVKRAKFRPAVVMLEERMTPANIFVDVTPGGAAGAGNGIFTPVGGANVTGLTLGTNLFTTVGAAVSAAATTGDSIMIANDPAVYSEAANATVITAKSLAFAGVGSASPVLQNTANRFFRFDGSNTAPVNVGLSSVAFVGADTGGGILVNTGFTNNAHVTLTTVRFQDNAGANGGAINVAGGQLTVNTSTFISNTTAGDGGAIAIVGGTGHTITGSSFTNNSAGIDGGAIELDAGTLVLDPTTIDGNTAAGDGGGVNVTAGTFTLSAGDQVTNNTSIGGDGGGIALQGGTGHTLTGATIASNHANAGRGGGLFVTNTDVTIDGMTIGGAAIANANTAANGGGIGVSVAAAITFANANTIRFNTASANGGGIDLDPTATTLLTIGNGVTLRNNQTTAAASHGGGISARGGSLTLNNASIIANQATLSGSSGGGLYISGTAVVNANGTTAIGAAGTPNTAAGNGGGVHVDGGTFTLASTATIASNTAANIGGGLFQSDGTANINGTISNNQATGNGGGVFLIGGTLNFNTGATITGNSTGASGGGIVVASVGVATLNGTISNNTATTSATGAGGGLFVAGGSATLNGATIGGPTAADGNDAANGGGIAISAGTLTFSTAATTVRFNTATTNGGGVALLSGFTGTVNSAALLSVLDNTITATAGHGAGIAVLGNSTLTMTGGAISRNSFTLPAATSGSGGGIYMNNGSVNISGLVIGGASLVNGNSATGNGGGVHVDGGTFTLAADASIAFNSATNIGGGLFQSDGTANINGTISNNQATGNGGGAFVIGGTFNFNTGATITGNSTGASGGGIVVASVGVATLSGTISNNTATTSTGTGGGLLVAGGNVTLNGATIGGATAAAGNDATSGGGIAISAGTLTFSTAVTTVRFNTATQNGGGVALLTGFTGSINTASLLNVLDNTITAANGHGAGIAVLGNSTLTMGGGAIGRNSFALPAATGGTGGGLYQNGGTVNITGVLFGGALPTDGNSASDSGGAIHVNAGTLSLTAVTIRNNVAVAGSGGGIHITGGTNHSLSTSTVAANRALAGSGGGINAIGPFASTLTIIGSTIGGGTVADGNQASATGNGGGINFAAGSLTASSAATTIRNNTAGIGAGISFQGTTLSLTNSIVSNNTAALRGGGIAIFSGTNTIDNTTIRSNTANGLVAATDGGGGIFQNGGNTTTDPTIINGNSAVGNGGGVNVLAGAFIMSAGDEVTNNSSTGGNGGGINFAGGTGHVLTSVLIAQNTAFNNGGGVNLAGTLGAGTVAITNSIIGGGVTTNPTTLGNSAGANGGGINAAGGVLTLTGTTIGGTGALPGNTTTIGDGGGINITGAAVTITGGTIGGATTGRGNTAAANGGGIELFSGTLSFVGAATTVQFNHATAGAGGGLDITIGANVNITNGTDFLDNDANTSGGGIAQRAGGILTITNADILRNRAISNNGGGVFISGNGNTNINTSTIAANTAAVNGGGVFLSGTGNLNIAGGTLGGATAPDGNVAAQSGGGIFLSAGALNLTASAVVRNNVATAGNGGGIFLGAAGDSTIANSTIAANRATAGSGGGIHVSGAFTNDLNLTTVIIGGATAADGNAAGTNGGGINVNAGVGGTVNLLGAVNNVIRNNTAAGTGGGVNVLSGSFTATVSTFQQNIATGNGGGLNVTAGSANITRTTFASNLSGANGGGIAITAGTLDLNNDTLAGNQAANGGAIAILGASVNTITNVTVAANNATTATGGIRQVGGATTIQNSLIGTNTSPGPAVDISVSGGAFNDLGNNLFQTFAGFAPAGSSITSQNPRVAALGSYGGPNQTVALLPGSPAINAGTGAGADQRGQPVFGGTKDIGAFESQGFAFGARTGTPQTTVINTNFANPLTVVVTANNGLEPVDGGLVTFTPPVAGASLNPNTPIVATITGGIASSGIVTANGTFGSYFVGLTSNGITPLPNAFSLKNLGVAFVTFVAQPTDTLSGAIINNPTGVTVQLLDQDNNPIGIAGVPVTLTLSFNAADIAAGFTPTLVSAPPIPINSNAAGLATFAGLTIATTGRYRLNASAPTNANPPTTTPVVASNQFNIRASNLVLTNVDTTVRSGAPMNPITVTAVGTDGSRDLFFTTQITLGIQSGPAGGTFIPAAPVPNATPPAFPNGGRVIINNVRLNRGGLYRLKADSISLATPITGNAPNTTQVNASAIAITNSASAGSTIFNPATGGNIMPPNSVRSSNQAGILDANKDILNVTVVGVDVLGLPADIAAAVTVTLNSGQQFRDGLVVPVVGSLGGVNLLNAPGSSVTFGQANSHLTIDRWGDYILRADAADGLGFAANALSGTTTVIGRQFTVTNPFIVIGPFVVTTRVTDITGDLAQNYTGPSDPTILRINEIANRQNPGITGGMGTSATLVGNTVVASATPFRGVTTFNFFASRPVLITTQASDQFQYFIPSDGSATIDTLPPGRRRPRPVPPVLTFRIRPT